MYAPLYYERLRSSSHKLYAKRIYIVGFYHTFKKHNVQLIHFVLNNAMTQTVFQHCRVLVHTCFVFFHTVQILPQIVSSICFFKLEKWQKNHMIICSSYQQLVILLLGKALWSKGDYQCKFYKTLNISLHIKDVFKTCMGR